MECRQPTKGGGQEGRKEVKNETNTSIFTGTAHQKT